MPSYGSLHSPSLHKMNGNLEEGSSRERRGMGHSFRFGSTLAFQEMDIADLPRAYRRRPFCSCYYLNSICQSTLKTAIAKFLADQYGVAGLDDCIYRFAHFRHTIRFPQFRMVGHCVHVVLYRGGISGGGIGLNPNLSCSGTQCAAATEVYAHIWQIVGFLAAGLVFTSSVINALVYSADGAKEAAAAGFILLSMVAVWHGRPWEFREHVLTRCRSCGSFTSDQHHKLLTEAISIPSPYIKSSGAPCATVDP